jgi:DeoR/GlpR family transcriptional regulator of sugar metabolism
MFAATRRQRILAWLEEEGSARVRDLAAAFGVSEVTIRQDLELLDSQGRIVREHGGAHLKTIPQQVGALALQHQAHMDEKRRIGRAAAALVGDGETIILDSGSTTTEVAANLGERRDLTVITNGLNIALRLGALPSISVHMPGGQFKAPTLSLSGEKSAEYFTGLFAQKLFLATAALSLDNGLTFPSLADLPVKRAMIASAERVILVADSSKIGSTSFTALAGVEVVHTLVTDSGIAPEDRAAFENLGIEVIAA